MNCASYKLNSDTEMDMALPSWAEEILSSMDSPDEALCAICGHKFVLRKSKLMNRGAQFVTGAMLLVAFFTCLARSGCVFVAGEAGIRPV